MKNKQISIILEQVVSDRLKQTHSHLAEAPKTTNEIIKVEYEVVQLKNAVVIEWNCAGRSSCIIRVGARLSEEAADEIARCKVYEVSIRK